VPPLPPSCAPPHNGTFFCTAASCYLLGPALAYDQAAASCAAAAPGASLAVYTSAEEQLGVELYFRWASEGQRQRTCMPCRVLTGLK
jgi:hypothetical protein